MNSLGAVSLLVRDYDDAIRFYVDSVGFTLVEDTELGDGVRWVVVRPDGLGSGIVLARADGPEQEQHVGNQTGGRVGFFLHTDDFEGDHARMVAAGVWFHEAPRRERYGTVAVFEDLYGNTWDLIQPA